MAARLVLAFALALGLFGGRVNASAGDAHGTARGGKWIEVILSEQRLIAWEGRRAVMSSPVSTGKRATPTPRGDFRVFR